MSKLATGDPVAKITRDESPGPGLDVHGLAPGLGVPMADASRFQVLALDGGGVKALFTAHVLAQLEADLDIRVQDCFDLIAGTSAGGIIALALGAGLRPAEIVDHYSSLAKTVFPPSRRRWWRTPSRALRTTYRRQPLQTALHDIFGDRRLIDSGKRLIVPSWDLHNGGVHIFKTPHHDRLRRDWRISMVDVGLATSAAPTFLPAARVDGLRLVDGGVWANNPSVLGIVEAFSVLDVPLNHIRVLNIGTTSELEHVPESLYDGGIASWARYVAPLMIGANSRGAEGISAHLVGKSNYARFDVPVPAGIYHLDNANQADLQSLAARASRQLSPEFTEKFGGHHATHYTPAFKPAAETNSVKTLFDQR